MDDDAPRPDAATDYRYLAIEMPPEFVLEFRDHNGDWCDRGLFGADQFQRLQDGSYICAGLGGSPTFLRCIRLGEGCIEVEYPDGTVLAARLTAFDG